MTEDEVENYVFDERFRNLINTDFRELIGRNTEAEKKIEEFKYFMLDPRTNSNKLEKLFESLTWFNSIHACSDEKFYEVLNLGLNNTNNSKRSIDKALHAMEVNINNSTRNVYAEQLKAVVKCIDKGYNKDRSYNDEMLLIEKMVKKDPKIANDALEVVSKTIRENEPTQRMIECFSAIALSKVQDIKGGATNPDLVLKAYQIIRSSKIYDCKDIACEAVRISPDIAKEELERAKRIKSSYLIKENADVPLDILTQIMVCQPELAKESFGVFEEIINSVQGEKDEFMFDKLTKLAVHKPEFAKDIFKVLNNYADGRSCNLSEEAVRGLAHVSSLRPELNGYVLETAKHFLHCTKYGRLQNCLFSIIEETPEHADKAISLIGKSLRIVGWRKQEIRYFDEDEIRCGHDSYNPGRRVVVNYETCKRLNELIYKHPEYREKVLNVLEKENDRTGGRTEWYISSIKRRMQIEQDKRRIDEVRKKMEAALKREIKETAKNNVSDEKGKVNRKQNGLKKRALAKRLEKIKSDPKYR